MNKLIRIFLAALLPFALALSLVTPVAAAGNTITLAANTNWSALTGGSGLLGIPDATDTVLVGPYILTVDVPDATVGNLVLGLDGLLSPLGTTGTLSFLNAAAHCTVATDIAITVGVNGLGVIDMTNGGTLTVTGTITGAPSGTLIPGTGTVEFNGPNGQLVDQILSIPTNLDGSGIYNNLTIAGTGTKHMVGDITSVGTFAINGGASLAAGTSKLTVYSDWNFPGTFIPETGTVSLAGSAQNVVNNLNFNNLSIEPTHIAGVDFTGKTVNIAGDFIINDSVTLTGSTFNFNGSVLPQNIGPLTYNNLNTSGTAVKILPFSAVIDGVLNIGAASTLQGGGTLFINGNWVNAGTFDPSTSYVAFSGSVPQTTTGATSFFDFELINGNGLTINNDITVSNIAYLNTGNINTGANKVIIPAGGTITRTTGQVVGNLQKNVPVGAAALTYEVGTASGYNPVDIAFNNVATSGDLTVKATTGQHPNIATSAIVAAKDVNVYWTLTNAGTVFDTASAVFNFNAGDVIGGADPANFMVGKYSGGWTYPTIGTKTTTNIQATGLTSLSDFAIGEQPPATQVTFTTTAQSIAAGAVSTIITVQQQTATGFAPTVIANTDVNLTSTSATGRFDTSAAGLFNGLVTKATIPAGQNSASFYYKDTATGAPTITANVTGLTPATQQETITAGGIDHYAVSAVASPQSAGIPFSVTIRAQDVNNNNITSGSETVTITTGLADPVASPPLVLTTSGTATFGMTVNTIYLGQNLIFTGAPSGKTGTSNNFDIIAPVPAKLGFSTSNQTIAAGSASGVITVQLQDAANQPINAPSGTTVNLTSTSATGRFDTSASGPFDGNITSVVVLAGLNSADFYYKDTAAGTPTVTASGAALANGTQQETITVGLLDHYAFATISAKTTGTPFSVTVQAKDVFNNNLTTGGETGNITVGMTDAGATPASATIANGTATFNMTLTAVQASQNLTFTGTTSGKTGISNTFAVSAPVVVTGGGGGGGGGAPAYSTPTVTGLVYNSSLKVDSAGVAQGAAQLKTDDGKVVIDVGSGTKLTDSNNAGIKVMSAELLSSPPAPPAQNAVVMAYDFGPSGAKFNPPINLTLKYDPASLPAGVAESTLYIAWWNGTEWQTLTGTVDTVAKTITVQITHFSIFAVVGKIAPAPAATPSPSPVAKPTVTPATAPTAAPNTPASPAPQPSPTAMPVTETAPTNWTMIIGIGALALLVIAGIIWLKRRNG